MASLPTTASRALPPTSLAGRVARLEDEHRQSAAHREVDRLRWDLAQREAMRAELDRREQAMRAEFERRELQMALKEQKQEHRAD